MDKLDELNYGPIKVVKGKYKGRIGCYDDDIGDKSAYIYWGNMVSTLDTGAIIRKSSITNEITTYDLVERANFNSRIIKSYSDISLSL